MSAGLLQTRNGQPVPRASIPRLAMEELRRSILTEIASGGRLAAFWGRPESDGVLVTAALARDERGTLHLGSAVVRSSYPALTPECPQAHLFERELHEQCGVVPEGHPWDKPVRFPAGGAEIGVADFFTVGGQEVHEVAVGPVHAGIIEPGHFRFQCHGERVLHLEISLGYQHRGVERLLREAGPQRAASLVEVLAGDTSVGHATAHAQAVETLSGCRVSARAAVLRGVALELERLANHTGDLGALAGDVGYLPTMSYCGRLRGDLLNMTALGCGNRFGRGWIRPGGVAHDLDPERAQELLARMEVTGRELGGALELLWESPSSMARFEGTGRLDAATCRELGIVGPAARATGLERDVRRDHPSGVYCFAQIPVSTLDSGDVYSRAFVRWLEIQRSITFVREQVAALPDGELRSAAGDPRPDHLVLSLVEGWRGEIVHAVETDGQGKVCWHKVVDPSFHNWFALAFALRGQQISDFPLCNKSFNLSYCGHDL